MHDGIFGALFATYGDPHWWPAQDDFEMMMGAVLTQNTAWSNVERALAQFHGQLSPTYILDCTTEELSKIIRPAGFFNQKAPRLKALAAWYEKYSFDIHEVRKNTMRRLREELLSINGIGPETADSIVLYACEKPIFVIDAYTRRIFSRLGHTLPKDYQGLQEYLMLRYPYPTYDYGICHALLVVHAKEHCRSKPTCAGCPIQEICQYTPVE